LYADLIMKTLPIAGTLQTVTFFEDDTLETVRQLLALAVGSHPDRLFAEVKASLPKDTYDNPLQWSTLFYRLSFDGARIVPDMLKIYTTQTRPGTMLEAREISKEEWDAKGPELAPLYAPEVDFEEWRVLGVEDTTSFCMPLPPRDLPSLQAANRPTLKPQSLFETLHPYEVTEVRATEVSADASPNVRLNYVPRLRPDTPTTIEPLRAPLEAAQLQLRALLQLETPPHQSVSIVRAKWYIPLVSTQITAPRTRFEQMFYGLTVSPKVTPYVGFFTAKTETLRHKFYVADPKAKQPSLDIPVWRGWLSKTLPQRRLPTLLLYRGGSSRTEFDRIAITERDITVDVHRDKASTTTLDELQAEMSAWLLSLDAVLPFLDTRDLGLARWQLSTLAALASYGKEVREFDMLRFPCLQGLFSVQPPKFRLLRAEHTSDEVTPQDLQILDLLRDAETEPTPDAIATELSISVQEVEERLARVRALSEELNLEKSLRAYPTIEFRPKEVLLNFVTDLERTLHYANLLRHVLTSDSEQVDAICPKRMERVGAKVVVPQTEVDLDADFAADDAFNALLGFGADEAPAEGPAEETLPLKSRKVKVSSRAVGTYNYFNARLQEFDPATFDKSIYPNKCDKPRQVVVLTPADTARLGPSYNYSEASPDEVLALSDPDGTAICPPYWCVRDELPLREAQLITGPDGAQHCPKCNGKVRVSDDLDLVEYPVIKRDVAAKFPDTLKAEYASTKNGRRIPCCYQSPRAKTTVLSSKEDATYVLEASSQTIGPLRFAYLDAELAERLQLPLTYEESVKKGRIGAGNSDVFRVGVGRPSETAEKLLGASAKLPRPNDAPRETLLRCSFFRSWPGRGAGDTELDRIVSSIDQAYTQGTLGFLEELEYVASVLTCEVIRVDRVTGQVLCGFGGELGGSAKTVVLLGQTILARVSRTKTPSGYKTTFQTDLRKAPFPKATLTLLLDRHARACASSLPSLSDAIAALMSKGKAQYQVILDPFKRVQAVFVPREGLLPVVPSTTQVDAGVPIRSGYSDVRDDELPTLDAQLAFLEGLSHPMFAVREPIRNVTGVVVEVELASGFRVPVRPGTESAAGPAREVTETVRRVDEETLVSAPPNAEDLRTAERVAYESEIFDFLLFSLSTSIESDAYGQILKAEYQPLRTAIETRSPTLLTDLQRWFKAEAFEGTAKSPVAFVNKVRTPCGQYTDKAACESSSLCGWKQTNGKKLCKIRVNPVVDTAALLRRITKTLRENDKQRALVLDGRMSPFFSTMLYLELPHELITTTI
jgi:hypothetical protein